MYFKVLSKEIMIAKNLVAKLLLDKKNLCVPHHNKTPQSSYNAHTYCDIWYRT